MSCVWYMVKGKAMPLTSKNPVMILASSCNGVGVFPLSLLKVRKSSRLFSIEDRIMFGKGATKKMAMTHRGFQLLYSAHERRIRRKPKAKNAERKMILFKGFMTN